MRSVVLVQESAEAVAALDIALWGAKIRCPLREISDLQAGR
jgi:hypothetical protein